MNPSGHDLPPFPPEADWLAGTPPPGLPSAEFADRVLEALADEQALDHALDAADRDLPRILLTSHEAPAPSADFAARTLAAVQQDRRTRWQQLLARYVSPAPSPAFVQRTLQALAHPPAATRLRLPRRATTWLLAAAAAAAAVLLLVRDRPAPDATATGTGASVAAYASLSGAVFAAVAAQHDPMALDDRLPDGTLLLAAEVR